LHVQFDQLLHAFEGLAGQIQAVSTLAFWVAITCSAVSMSVSKGGVRGSGTDAAHPVYDNHSEVCALQHDSKYRAGLHEHKPKMLRRSNLVLLL
jgi:hypothetical protein